MFALGKRSFCFVTIIRCILNFKGIPVQSQGGVVELAVVVGVKTTTKEKKKVKAKTNGQLFDYATIYFHDNFLHISFLCSKILKHSRQHFCHLKMV